MFNPVRDLKHALQRNVLLETAVTAFVLGVVGAGGCAMAIHAWWYTGSAAEFAFGLHLVVVHVLFHFSEFAVAAALRPRETHPEAFMIFHSPAYLAANLMSLVEFAVEVFLVPETWKFFGGDSRGSILSWLFRLNMGASLMYGALTVFFYGIRVVAMLHCGPNFSLMIESEKRQDHTLVRSGLYSVLRHPAYFGWFWRIPFSQLMLANPVCAVTHTLVTWVFFADRIPYEEETLMSEEFFGAEYRRYMDSTIVGIPFLRLMKRKSE